MQLLQLALFSGIFSTAWSSLPEKIAKTSVKVYSGDGAAKDFVEATFETLKRLLSPTNYEVERVYAKDLVDPAWISKTSLLVIPGGRATPYARDLNGTSNNNIINFVKNGGKYIGFCAGGYYAANKVEFMLGSPYEINKERPLKFYPDTMKGPTFPGFEYNSEAGGKAANVTFSFPKSTESFESLVYYNGGGSFQNVEKYNNVEVLAKYNDVTENSDKIAAILCHFGQGKALLTGIHPEYFPKYETSKFYNELKIYRDVIDKILLKWFQILNLDSKDTSPKRYKCVPHTTSSQFTLLVNSRL